MPKDDTYTLGGATKGTEFEDREHNRALFAKRTSDVPTDMQMLADYGGRTDEQPIYLGFAFQGVGQAGTTWLIQKFTYDSNNRTTSRQSAYGAWSNRTGLTYS